MTARAVSFAILVALPSAFALADLGMYSGELDGTLSEATRNALKTFQAERSLPDTGLPDQETLFRLLQTNS